MSRRKLDTVTTEEALGSTRSGSAHLRVDAGKGVSMLQKARRRLGYVEDGWPESDLLALPSRGRGEGDGIAFGKLREGTLRSMLLC